MSTTTFQVVGFLLSLLGLAGCIAATGMDMWSTQDLYDNPVTSVFQYEGLWRSCVRQSSGFTECRPYFTILGLPGRCGHPGQDQESRPGRVQPLGCLTQPCCRLQACRRTTEGVNKSTSWLGVTDSAVTQETMGGFMLGSEELLAGDRLQEDSVSGKGC